MVDLQDINAFVIRDAKYSDAGPIMEIENACYQHSHYLTQFSLRAFILASNGGFRVAVDEFRQIRGFCFGSVVSTEIAWAHCLRVAPEMRRQGLGERLLRDSMHILGSRSQSVLSSVHPKNQASLNLHEKMGWKLITDPEPIVDFYGPGEPRHIFQLRRGLPVGKELNISSLLSELHSH